MKANLNKIFKDWQETNDDNLFTRLYLNTQKIIFSIFNSYFEDKAKLNDIIQNSWLKIIEKPERVDLSKGDFINYFATMIKNESLKQIEKDKKIEPLLETDFEDIETEEIDLSKENLGQFLMGIPEIFRDVLILHYYYDVEVKEIGRMLGVEKNTVKTRMLRGKKAIKNLLESK
jgi:RNA polymerase sigma-70 factor (ECF subfamily)